MGDPRETIGDPWSTHRPILYSWMTHGTLIESHGRPMSDPWQTRG